VGFIPIKVKEGEPSEEPSKPTTPRRTYEEVELLEVSQVTVPSNRDAIQSLRSKSANPLMNELVDEIAEKYEELQEREEPATKTGRVLSHANENKIREAKKLLDEVLAQLESEIEEEGEIAPATKPYPNEHSCRLKDPAQYDTCRRGERVADKPDSVAGKKYYVIYCKKGDGPMEQQAFRYPKENWTAAQAKAHCEYNDGAFEPAREEEAKPEDTTNQDIDEATLKSIIKESVLGELRKITGKLD
jgi:hypothetical protein